MQRFVAIVSILVGVGCAGFIRVNGKPLGGSSSSSSPSAAAPEPAAGRPSRRVDDPVGELARRRAAQAAQEPKLPPLKRVAVAADLGAKPMIVDVEAAPSAPFTKRWDFAGEPCADAMAPAALVEFEVTAATSQKLQIVIARGAGGMLLERPDGSALISCAGQANHDRPGIWMPKAGWPPGTYRIWLTDYRASQKPVELEVQFSVVEPARPRNEVWIETCFADYADLRAKWGPVEDKTRAALAAIDGTDFYRDYPKLVELYLGLRKQIAELKLNAGASYAYATSVGAALEVLRAIHEVQRRHHRDSQTPFALDGGDLAHFTTGDDAFNRDVYCYEATARGTPRVKPHWEGHLDEAPAWMKRPEQRAFLERYAKLREDGRRAAEFTPGPKVASDAGYVGSISRSGGDLVFVLETYDSRENCRETSKVERVRPDGTIEYRLACDGTYSHQTFRRKVVIPAKLVPARPAIKVKDYVSFHVDPATLVENKPSRGLDVELIQRPGKGDKEVVIGDWRLWVDRNR